jgi:branched-chain amino acid transport system ATP-binding protein
MSAAKMAVSTPVLSLDHITAGYGGTSVLRDLVLKVPAGSVVALLGPNGAGKTTAMRVAAGLLKPAAGAVLHGGSNVTAHSTAKRAKNGICLIPEGRGVFTSLTVRENISVLVKRRGHAAAVEKVVEAFPALADRLSQVVGTMSGGQQQMVAMARCYLSDANVILLDEVSMGLAPLVLDEIYESIRGLAERGTSLVIVEQYVDRVLAIADTVHVLNRGKVTFSTTPQSTSREELMRNYLHVVPEVARHEPGASPSHL